MLASRSRSELMRELRQSLAKLIKIETRFFQRIGVDQRLGTLGLTQERWQAHEYAGWDYSLEVLARLGVSNVHVKGDQQWEPEFTATGKKIYRIELKDLAELPSAAASTSPQ